MGTVRYVYLEVVFTTLPTVLPQLRNLVSQFITNPNQTGKLVQAVILFREWVRNTLKIVRIHQFLNPLRFVAWLP